MVSCINLSKLQIGSYGICTISQQLCGSLHNFDNILGMLYISNMVGRINELSSLFKLNVVYTIFYISSILSTAPLRSDCFNFI
jgi:hypothetical protein